MSKFSKRVYGGKIEFYLLTLLDRELQENKKIKRLKNYELVNTRGNKEQ